MSTRFKNHRSCSYNTHIRIYILFNEYTIAMIIVLYVLLDNIEQKFEIKQFSEIFI